MYYVCMHCMGSSSGSRSAREQVAAGNSSTARNCKELPRDLCVTCSTIKQECQSAPHAACCLLLPCCCPCSPEMVVGWYHSHPGFGCWLSGVDINTQQVGATLFTGTAASSSAHYSPAVPSCALMASNDSTVQQCTAAVGMLCRVEAPTRLCSSYCYRC